MTDTIPEAPALDLARFLVLVLLFWNGGVIAAASIRFGKRLYESKGEPTWQRRLWLARIVMRLGFLGLIYFAGDATLQHWGDPIRLRMVILATVLVILPWAHTELCRDTLWRERLDGERRE